MANQYVNKVVVAGVTKLDLTGDTADAEHVISGYTFHDKAGQQKTGTATPAENLQPEIDEQDDLIIEINDALAGKVGVPSSIDLQEKSATPSLSAQEITADAGYDGLSKVNVAAINSTLLNNLDSDFVAGNVKKDVNLFGLVGTFEGSGGSGMNVQAYQGIGTVKASSYTETDVTLTVAKTGKYTVSWVGVRASTGGTNGSQLYINGSAHGTAQTSFDSTNTYIQSVKLTNVSLTQGQTLVVRARSRGTSYAMSVGNLVIQQTA